MKQPFLIILALAMLVPPAMAQTSTEGVKKVTTTDAITEDLDFLTGRTLTVGSGATLTYSAGASFSGDAAEFRTDISAQTLDSDLTSIAALTTAAYGLDFLELANAAAARSYIGLGSGFDFSLGTLSLGVADAQAGTLILFDDLGSASGKVTFHDNNSGFISELSVGTLTASRTPNLPDASGTILLNDNAAVVTGKTINGPDNTITNLATASISDDAVTNAKAANMAQNTIKGRITASTGDPEDLTANQASTILDSATDPFVRTSANPSSPVLIATVVASASATVEFTSGLTSAYRRYQVVIDGLSPATDVVDFKMRVSDDAGSTWKSTANYNATIESDSMGFAPLDSDLTSQTEIPLNATQNFYHLSNVSGEHGFFTVNISDPSTSRAVLIRWEGTYMADDPGTTPFINCTGAALWGGSQIAVTGLQFYMSSGNIASGRFRLYGIP